MFTYTIMFGYDPKYYEDFHMPGTMYESADDALKDAMSWVDKCNSNDLATIRIYNPNDELAIKVQIFAHALL